MAERPAGIRKLQGTPKVNLLVYGHPGVGKTQFIGTGPDKTLIIRPPTDHTDSIKNEQMEELVIKDWGHMFEVLEWLREDEGAGYEWVWFDSISLWQDTGLDDIWQQVIKDKPHRAEYGLDKGEYGRNMSRLSQWVRFMVGEPSFNFGITAHPAEFADPFADSDSAEDILMPYVQGKNMSPKICGYMNVVAYLRVAKVQGSGGKRTARILTADAGDRWYGKNQYEPLPKGRLVDPTLPKLMDALGVVQPEPKAKTRRSSRRR